MTKPKLSRCAFVVIKLRFAGQDYFLMRRNPDWKDISFIGGHATTNEKANLERAARRELLEEVPALRSTRKIRLDALTPEFKYGPVYSHSAKGEVQYELQFFVATFDKTPKDVIRSVTSRSLNVLVPSEELQAPRKHRVAELVNVLQKRLAGGLSAIKQSWPEDLGRLAAAGQTELAF